MTRAEVSTDMTPPRSVAPRPGRAARDVAAPARGRARPGRARRCAALAAALVSLAAAAACGPLGGGSSKAVNCGDYQLSAAKAKNQTFPVLLVDLDVDDNSPDAASRIGAKLRPYLDTALRQGSYIRLVGSGGQDSGLSYSDCFTGQQVFKVVRNNSTREEKDRVRGVAALTTQISDFVRKTSVSQTGGVTSLLAGVPREVDTITGTPGVHAGAVTVLVWSSLLANSTDADCMNVVGKQASPTIAEAIVRRCFSTNQLTSVGSDKVRFVGVNDHPETAPQQDMARYLENELCRRLSNDCA